LEVNKPREYVGAQHAANDIAQMGHVVDVWKSTSNEDVALSILRQSDWSRLALFNPIAQKNKSLQNNKSGRALVMIRIFPPAPGGMTYTGWVTGAAGVAVIPAQAFFAAWISAASALGIASASYKCRMVCGAGLFVKTVKRITINDSTTATIQYADFILWA
jgi:predicted phage tail protein